MYYLELLIIVFNGCFHITVILICPISKGIGEPPLLLASSVFFAIKDAVRSARDERGLTREFEFNSPATCERIRMACADQFTEQVNIWLNKHYS